MGQARYSFTCPSAIIYNFYLPGATGQAPMSSPRVLPRIWKQGVKIEDFLNLGGRKLVTQLTRMIIATLYIDLAKQNMLLYVIQCTYCLLGVKLLKFFLGLKQIQKILQNTTGCHFPKNLVFGSPNDSLVVAWVSPCRALFYI